MIKPTPTAIDKLRLTLNKCPHKKHRNGGNMVNEKNEGEEGEVE